MFLRSHIFRDDRNTGSSGIISALFHPLPGNYKEEVSRSLLLVCMALEGAGAGAGAGA